MVEMLFRLLRELGWVIDRPHYQQSVRRELERRQAAVADAGAVQRRRYKQLAIKVEPRVR